MRLKALPALDVNVKSRVAVMLEILLHAIPYAPLVPTALISGEMRAYRAYINCMLQNISGWGMISTTYLGGGFGKDNIARSRIEDDIRARLQCRGSLSVDSVLG